MSGRKLATIRRIEEIITIPNADKIVAYRIGGWKVVDTKDKYKVDDLVVYLEVDSWVPTAIAPFLSKGKEPRLYKGVQGERLRTIKLRGQISQGLLLPVAAQSGNRCVVNGYSEEFGWGVGMGFEDGWDVTEFLAVQKWEPEPEFRSADAKGLFPAFIPKSDQERIQNCYNDVKELFVDSEWEITEKLEGQSHTAYLYNDVFGVCSRNLELKDSEDSTFWKTARKYDLEGILRRDGRNLMIQSEQVGPGIQGNIYRLDEHKLFVYDVFLIDEQRYMTPDERLCFCVENNLDIVPVVVFGWRNHAGLDRDAMIAMADGESQLYKTKREGLVFKLRSKERVSFKVISNSYLLSEKD